MCHASWTTQDEFVSVLDRWSARLHDNRPGDLSSLSQRIVGPIRVEDPRSPVSVEDNLDACGETQFKRDVGYVAGDDRHGGGEDPGRFDPCHGFDRTARPDVWTVAGFGVGADDNQVVGIWRVERPVAPGGIGRARAYHRRRFARGRARAPADGAGTVNST